MANIPRNRDYINDIEVSNDAPVTESLLNKIGANINDYLDHAWQSQTFTSNGTFNVPEGVTAVVVVGAGGGGGGGGGSLTHGGCGGAGAPVGVVMVPVTPLGSVSVTIGSAGAGGAAGVNGTSGGTSSFGTLAYFYGGFGGMRANHFGSLIQLYYERMFAAHADYMQPNVTFGPKMNYGGIGYQTGTMLDGEASFFAPGGSSAFGDNGGGGGGAALNEGGSGRGNNPINTGDAQGNGGAGGGGGGTNALTLAGGNGSPGKIIVYWYGVS